MRILLAFALVLFAAFANGQSVVINEIMYHPASHDSREEYIELYNRATTNVNLSGWALTGGVDFVIPTNTVIRALDYFVVAARRQTFVAKYPTITNVVGDYAVLRVTNLAGGSITNWENTLSNTRNSINLENAAGNEIDSVQYADEGDWARRQRGFNDGGFRGWTWYTEADGLGKSLELINSALPNEHGHNWTESIPVDGTPGRVNSVLSANIAPMIIDVAHFPVVPRSTNSISVTARIINESASGVTVTLRWRVDSVSPPAFGSSTMFDDGAHGDGLPGDGIYAVTIPAQVNNTVIEFYLEASDAQGNSRTWPAPAIAALDGGGPTGQVVNALLQVDDSPQNVFGGTSSAQPVYKIIMTEAERAELASIPGQSSNQGPNAQMNGTFISMDGVETLIRYTVGVRNRGHASRRANPPNYRINFVGDRLWKQIEALNLNTVQVHIQNFGSALAIKSGAAGNLSRAVQVRVNNVNRATSGAPMFGSYAANEVYGGEWADRQFPSDGGGNVYKVVRDIPPPNFDYRGEDKNAYINTYFKETNTGEDDWRDLIGMLSVMGENSGAAFTTAAARQVVNVEQWFTHLAVMNLLGNAESGINTGNNDDYYMYRGVDDPRFILMFHDLDQIIGQGGSFGTSSDIFRATGFPVSGDSEGIWRAMTIFMHWPDFEPIYYATLQRLLDTTFSKPQFDALIDQTLSSYVASGTINNMKTWMDARRTYVQGVINGLVPPATNNPVATISGEPRSPSPSRNATLTVGGDSITSYRFRLNNGAYSAETPVATPISLSNLPLDSTNTVYVVGKNSGGIFQSTSSPTVSKTWVVNVNTPTVRLNEVLAANNGAVNHAGTTPDVIELFNEGTASVDLSGLRLTNDKDDPNLFTFASNTVLAPGAYLTVYANNNDGSGGIHTGFSLSAEGDQLYLFDTAANGNTILDVVKFGPQVSNLSIGRNGTGGDWALTTPTFGSANVAQSLGNQSNLKINEWLTSSSSESDFIELYNPNALPVSLGGLYMTDRPIGAPALSQIADLSFVGGHSLAVFVADGDADKADHVNFQLPSEQGEIALLTPTLKTIDCIVYGPQRTGVSMGRCPDGSLTNRFLTFPTPAFMNSCPAVLPGPQVVSLIAYPAVWRYDQTSNYDGVNWMLPDFDDSAWPTGQGVFGTATLGGEPVRTTISLGPNTYYFRTRFVLPSNMSFTTVQLGHYIDDGAVIYVNGEEVYRYNMSPGPVFYSTSSTVNNAGVPSEIVVANFPLTDAVPGTNVLAVEVHQRPLNPGGGDAYMGVKLEGLIVTNTAAQAGILINEILADNATAEEPDGSTPDWVELYNPSSNAVNLADMSLSDSLASPRRWVFPAGSIIAAQGYFRVRFDSDLPSSTTNTGYGLRTTGDAVYLFNTLADGGGVRDVIIFGIQIPDYSIARLPNGTTNLALPTIGFPNIAATLGDPRQLKVNEWMSNPLPGEDDFFEIYNPGSQPIALGGLWLTDVLTTRNKHQIAPLSFIGAITNAWTEFKADGNTASGADHVSFSLRAAGEDVGISLSDLTLIDGISFTNQAEGVSSGRLPDGAGAVMPFPATASPGSANYLPLATVAVNEALTHTDLPFEDAIELRNLTGTNINIGGWWLSDAQSQPQRYQIPFGTILPANGFAVFYEYQFNSTETAVVPFSLSSAKGDQIYLSMANSSGILTGYRAVAEFDAAANGVSFGRYVNSAGAADFVAMQQRTFGVDNPSNVGNFRTGTGSANTYPLVGPVVFTEIMYNPPMLGTNDNTRDEFLEIRNMSGATVSLFDPAYPTNRWRLRGGVDFDFPGGMSIPAGGTLLIVGFDPATNAAEASAFKAVYGLPSDASLLGPWSGKLDNGGERIELQRPDVPQLPPSPDAGLVPYIVVERILYSDNPPWATNADGAGRSLQRVSNTGYGNDPTNWVGAIPTPQPGSAGSSDSDGDGMPDTWEQMHGLVVGVNDAGGDPDQDGMTNLQEYLAGTDPQSAASKLSVAISIASANAARVQFNAAANISYTLQHRTSLSTGSWLTLQSVPAAPSNRTVIITNAPGTSTRFYRVTVP
jgi:hypothetical protein